MTPSFAVLRHLLVVRPLAGAGAQRQARRLVLALQRRVAHGAVTESSSDDLLLVHRYDGWLPLQRGSLLSALVGARVPC